MNDASDICGAIGVIGVSALFVGGLTPGAATEVARETGVPEADVYGVGTFYHLLARPDAKEVSTGFLARNT
ncbi:MAG: hypothetical protein ACO3P9_11940, partial [Phycisphaerales bacterium]